MIGPDFQYRDKIPVAILGATGSVGQKFVELLSHHPWFQIQALAASDESAGKAYIRAANWQMPSELENQIGEMKVQKCKPGLRASIVFSALDAQVAGEIEEEFANHGYLVISNCRNHRMEKTVPLLIPEVNEDHLRLLPFQPFKGGKIVTNPNCSVTGLAMALKPLDLEFGLEDVSVVTLQAISGAGFKGKKEIDIEDNVIPFIKGEEEKIESEILKILGTFDGEKIEDRDFAVSLQCNRVPVTDGHLQCVSVKLSSPATEEEIIHLWDNFQGNIQGMKLPSAPKMPLHYFREENFPQTKLHRDLERGMAVSLGRLRKCPVLDFKFTLLVHNTVRGAAGTSILNAELMTKLGLVFW